MSQYRSFNRIALEGVAHYQMVTILGRSVFFPALEFHDFILARERTFYNASGKPVQSLLLSLPLSGSTLNKFCDQPVVRRNKYIFRLIVLYCFIGSHINL